MKILGIDSSGMVAGIAIVEDDITVAEYCVNYKKTHSQTLMPMLDDVVRLTEQDLESIDAIAVSAGPGSFTGLRIGAATAKGLALALDKPIVSVPTCHALAFNVWGTDSIVCPIMDARRNQVYTGIYRFCDNELTVIQEQTACDINELIGKLNELCADGQAVIFVGDGIPVYREAIESAINCKYAFAPAHMNRQRAASVAALGGIYYNMGKAIKSDDFKPEYLRKSQAEREQEEREQEERKKAEQNA